MAKGLPPLPGGPTPVEVHKDLNWAYNGFWRLSNARPQGMTGPVRIPFAEIAAYCQLHGYDYGKRQEFLFYIERMDSRYMEFVKKLQEEEERKNQTKQNGGRPQPKSRG